MALGVTAALLLATVPPLLAAPTPVVLDARGEENAKRGGWYDADIGVTELEMLGGLVHIEAHALRKDDAGGPAAAYSWSSVKIPAMLPRHLVEERLRDAAVEQLNAEGVRIHALPRASGAFTANGHDGQLTHYTGSTRESNVLNLQVDVDIAILTWRCSLLGAYGVAFGVGKIEPLETEDDVIDLIEEITNGETPHNATAVSDILDAPLRSPYIEEMKTRLMPHTVCA